MEVGRGRWSLFVIYYGVLYGETNRERSSPLLQKALMSTLLYSPDTPHIFSDTGGAGNWRATVGGKRRGLPHNERKD